MANEVFLIYRTDFDRMENDVSAARSQKILGFVEDEEKASKLVLSLNESEEKKKAWDGESYPQFNFEKTRRIPS